MKNVNLFSEIMNIPQWVILGIFVIGIVILLVALIYLLYIMIYKPEIKAELRMVAKQFNEQKKLIVAGTEKERAQIRRSLKEIEEKERTAMKFNTENEILQMELMLQGMKAEDAKHIAGMTLEELLTLKDQEKKDLSGHYIINAITRKVLIDSEFVRRKDVEGFKVPANLTTEFAAEDVENCIKSLYEITHEHNARTKMDIYNIMGKAFAMFTRRENGFWLKIKCGTYYGQRLTQLYPQFFAKARFPSSMLWFDVLGKDGCSLELVRLLIKISYNVAKAGY